VAHKQRTHNCLEEAKSAMRLVLAELEHGLDQPINVASDYASGHSRALVPCSCKLFFFVCMCVCRTAGISTILIIHIGQDNMPGIIAVQIFVSILVSHITKK
jgi:hypothetical protein